MSGSIKSNTSRQSGPGEARADFLTIDEVAEILRVPVLTVRWLRQEGRFAPAIRVGRRLLWDRRELDDWINGQRESTEAS